MRTKISRYYYVTQFQIFSVSLAIGLIAASIGVINSGIKEHLEMPIVYQSADGACRSVANFRNGDAFTSQDINVTLRKFRTVNE